MNASRRLDDLLQQLPREQLPQRDLWPGIALELQQPAITESTRLAARWRPVALAASVVLVAALSYHYGQPQQSPFAEDAQVEEYISSLRTPHQLNKQAILVEFQNNEAFAPDWQEQLQQLEDAENVIYDALRHDPSNLELLKILRDVQDKQLKLIDAVFAPSLNPI